VSLITILFLGCSKFKGNLDGFLDISWGENIKNSALILTEKGFSIEYITDDSITAKGKYLEEEADVFLVFFENRFYGSNVTIWNKNIVNDFNKIKKSLEKKYGKTTRVLGDDEKRYIWDFDNNCHISTSSDSIDSICISIFYNNTTISNERKNKENKN
jgi:hypothetical protein